MSLVSGDFRDYVSGVENNVTVSPPKLGGNNKGEVGNVYPRLYTMLTKTVTFDIGQGFTDCVD